MAPMMTDMAPRGVTRMAGANVYAAKLATGRGQHETGQMTVSEYRTFPDDHYKVVSLASLIQKRTHWSACRPTILGWRGRSSRQL